MRLLSKCVLSFATIAALMLLAAPALADWYAGDSYKMHFPQPPNPNGWDVEISSWDNQHECADDWRCTSTGTVDDIHFWYSVNHDAQTEIESVVISIYPDDQTGPFSKPCHDASWTRTFDESQFSVVHNYGSGLQGFADPQQPDTWTTGVDNHIAYNQINIENILSPFFQVEGNTYWLGIHVYWNGTQEPVGWKTSTNHYQDYAVYRTGTNGPWAPLVPGIAGQSPPYPLDFAFVITPEPSSLVLLGSGVLGLLAYAWRRRRS
jgi:hypothetical protein